MKKKIIVLLVLSLLIGINSLVLERYFIRFPEYEIRSERIPKSFDGYKIAVLSDLHYGFLVPEFWIEHAFESINRKNPDLILGLGDYVRKRNYDRELAGVWPLLKRLKGKDGEFFVNGNHDHWADHELALELLESSGKSLRKRYSFVRRGTDRILIAGLGDYWEDHTPIDDVLQGSSKDDYRIVMAHNPDSSNTKHKEPVDLFVTGHTHGGQVRIPFFRKSPILPVNDKNFDIGIKHSKFKEPVLISAGIGWSIIPIRFNCPIEIPLIILRSK